jgi:formylglycine-generating enzyme required for sulfatase activity
LQTQVQLTVVQSMVDRDSTEVYDPDATVLDEEALSEKSRTKGTSTRALMGTFAYMSPEQKRGDEAGPASDLYSVGLMAYQLLTGLESIGMKVPSRLNKGIDSGWDDWVEKATEPNVADRFESAREMLETMPREGKERTAGKGVAIEEVSHGGTENTEIEREDAEVFSGKVGSRNDRNDRDVENGVSAGREKVAGKKGWGVWLALLFVILCGSGLGYWYFGMGGSKMFEKPPVAEAAVSGSESLGSVSEEVSNGGTVATEKGNRIGMADIDSDTDSDSDFESGAEMAAPVFRLEIDPVEASGRLWLGSLSDVAFSKGVLELEGLESGEHELIVKAPGYQTYTTRVSVGEGGNGSHAVRLVAVKGSLEVKSDPGVKVVATGVDGMTRSLGETNSGGVLVLEDLLNIGDYRLELSKTKHQSQTREVELMLGRMAKVEADLLPNPGEVRVFTVPEGADVFLNAKELGKSPLTLRSVPSEQEHNLEVRLSGYRREREKIELKPEEVRNVDFGTLVAESGSLLVKSELSGLEILLNGKAETGRNVSGGLLFDGLEVGALSVSVSHPDYERWSQSVRIEDEKRTSLDLDLQAKPGTLSVSVSPSSANWEIFLEGRSLGKESSYSLPAEKDLKLSIRAKGYLAAEKQLRLRANGSERWSVRLEEQPGPSAGSDWGVELPGGSELALKWISPGSFTMGSPSNESGRDSDEKQRQVRISKGYWLGKYEVTQGEWESVMGNNPSDFKASGKRAPVEQVSWNDAMAFCKKLNERERAAGRLPPGYAYTLPTEAEWEYACRAGTTTRFSTGNADSDLGRAGWYSGNAGGKTHAVGEKVANAWGLYDMHGNVWEWCYDWFGDYSGSNVTDPTGANSGSYRVLRGGCWSNGGARNCRSAIRVRGSPGDSWDYLGFRLALSSSR